MFIIIIYIILFMNKVFNYEKKNKGNKNWMLIIGFWYNMYGVLRVWNIFCRLNNMYEYKFIFFKLIVIILLLLYFIIFFFNNCLFILLMYYILIVYKLFRFLMLRNLI